MIGTLVVMGSTSLACMVIEKVCTESGKMSHAQYASIFGSTSLAVIALKSAAELFKFLKTL